MTRILGVVALATALLPAAWASGVKPATEPFQYREDFESGELKSWASYPPAQDVAWDPTLTATSVPAVGRYALQRTFQPVRPGRASFGVIKKIRFLAAPSAHLKFSYFVHSYFRPESLRVVLCGADGKRYTHTIASPALNSWEVADVTFEHFHNLAHPVQPGLGIQAIYWELDLSDALPEDRYFLYLDNLEISGERPAELEATSPRTFVAAERAMPLALKHYVPGDSLSLAVRGKEASPRLTAVSCAVMDAAGRSLGNFAFAQDSFHPGTWSNPSLFRIEAGMPRGVWQAEITALRADGRTETARFEFLVTDPWPQEVHPRLYFRQADRERLRQRTQEPGAAALWNEIQATARQLRTTVNIRAGREIPKLASNPSFEAFRPYSQALRQMAALVQTNAFVYWLTGDAEAKEAARQALLEASRWETWTFPWFTLHGRYTYYPAGIFTAALALGYDLLYPVLSPDERELVRHAILDKGALPAFREYYLNNQIPFHTSNWISHTVGGPLIGLLAVAETPDEAEPYFSGLLRELRDHWEATYLADGSYGESIDYQRFDLESSSPFLASLKNVLHVELAEKYHLAGSYLYPIYAFLPPDRYLDFGDTSDRMGALTPWAWMAADSRDSRLQWYYGQYLKQRDAIEDAWRTSSVIFDFIGHDPQLAAAPPVDLPASRYFPNKGGAVFRSGWDEDALVLNFTAGPFFNHNHLDQGSFWLAAFGEILLAEAGITEFYTDEYYRPYFIQSAGHNTVLVDGNPASQRIADQRSEVAALNRYPRIPTALLSESHDQVRAELEAVYPQLSGFSRTIMFVKPRYFVLFDQLESGEKHRYSQIFHPLYADDLEVDGSQAWVRKPKARLWMKFLAPRDVHLSKQPGHVPVRDILRLDSRPLHSRAYLEAGAHQATEKEAFLVLLLPQREGERGVPEVEKIEVEGLLGLRLQSEDWLDRIGFALQRGKPLQYQDIGTDGRSFRVSQLREDKRVISFENATYFQLAGKLLMRSDRPISAVQFINKSAATWEIASPTSCSVIVYSEAKPARVQVNGEGPPTSAYSYDPQAHDLKLSLPAGTHTISVTY